MDSATTNPRQPAADRGMRSLTRDQVLAWRSYWSDEDRAYIADLIDRFGLVSFTVPRVAQYVWCSNGDGERVIKILPGCVEAPGEGRHQLSSRQDNRPVSREEALRWYPYWSTSDRAFIESEIDRLGVDSFAVPRSEGYVKCLKEAGVKMVLHPGFVEGFWDFDFDHEAVKGDRAGYPRWNWRHSLSTADQRARASQAPVRPMNPHPAPIPPEIVLVTVYYDGDEGDTDTFVVGPRDLAKSEDLAVEVYSPQSALGAAVVGAAPGESVSYNSPTGTVEVTVVSVEPFRPATRG